VVALKQVEEMIQMKIPDALVFVKDLTGGGDHLEAVVISDQFTGQTKVKQHQLVYSALNEHLSTEAIHALALKTYTQEAWKKANQTNSI
jgi:stress-induced morphogen